MMTRTGHPVLSAGRVEALLTQYAGVESWQAGVDLLFDSILAWKAGGVVDGQGRVDLEDDHVQWSSGERLLWDLCRSLLAPSSGHYRVDMGALVDKVDDDNLAVVVGVLQRAARLAPAHERWGGFAMVTEREAEVNGTYEVGRKGKAGTLTVAPVPASQWRGCDGPHDDDVAATVEIILDSGAHQVLVVEWCDDCLRTSDLGAWWSQPVDVGT